MGRKERKETERQAKLEEEQLRKDISPYKKPDEMYPKMIDYLKKAEQHLEEALQSETHDHLRIAEAYATLVSAHASLAVSAEIHTLIPASRLAMAGSLLR